MPLFITKEETDIEQSTGTQLAVTTVLQYASVKRDLSFNNLTLLDDMILFKQTEWMTMKRNIRNSKINKKIQLKLILQYTVGKELKLVQEYIKNE